MRPALVIGTACPANSMDRADMTDSSSPLSSPPPSSVIDASFSYDDIDIPSPPVFASSRAASPSPSQAGPSQEAAAATAATQEPDPDQDHIAIPDRPGKGDDAPPARPQIAESVEVDDRVDGVAQPGPPPPEMAPYEHTRSRSAQTPAPKNGTPPKKEPATPKITITRSGRRSTRKRSASVVEDKTPVKASPSSAAVAKRLKREAARWQTESVLTSTRSPLINYDIRALLCNPRAWSVLAQDEKKEILSLFPGDQHILDPGTDQARPNIPSLKNDDNFRHDCAQYQNNLKGGFHDKEWLEEAYEAYEMRKMGVFDDYVIEEFESSWEVELPDEYKPPSMRAVQPAENGAAATNGQDGKDDQQEEKQQQSETDGSSKKKDKEDSAPREEKAGSADNSKTASDGEGPADENQPDLENGHREEAAGKGAATGSETKVEGGEVPLVESSQGENQEVNHEVNQEDRTNHKANGNGASLDDHEKQPARKRRKTPSRGLRTRSASAATEGGE